MTEHFNYKLCIQLNKKIIWPTSNNKYCEFLTEIISVNIMLCLIIIVFSCSEKLCTGIYVDLSIAVSVKSARLIFFFRAQDNSPNGQMTVLAHALWSAQQTSQTQHLKFNIIFHIGPRLYYTLHISGARSGQWSTSLIVFAQRRCT